MRVLLDTNIIVHREATSPVKSDIGEFFRWIDNLHYQKYVHPLTVNEISRLKNESSRSAMTIKIQNYNVLKTTASLAPEVVAISLMLDQTENDKADTAILNEVYADRVDILITEDRKIHEKANRLGIGHKVFTIDAFLETVTSEHPELIEYKIPSVTKEYFGNIDVSDNFFDSFREDYGGFDRWFRRKSDEVAYVCRADDHLLAFLYLKPEYEDEPYSDISPSFGPARRLKVGTFKVRFTGFKIGERFLKIVFDNAVRFLVSQIYVTLFQKTIEQEALVTLLTDFGFRYHGKKSTPSGEEDVFVRDFGGPASQAHPCLTYPFFARQSRKFIVPIYPKYHTSLFPDSILRTESPMNFVEHEPFRNAIRKIYVSRSLERDLKSGDVIVFYRTGGYYRGVVTTIGIVESVHTDIRDFEHFSNVCAKRSVFSEKELQAQWDWTPRNRPFVVEFLYAYSLPKRPNLKELIELGAIKDIHSVPRGFEQITLEAFEHVLRASETDTSIVVDQT
jgi:predicted nucleic acid-binding protein